MPQELVLGEEAAGDCSRRYAAPPYACFGLFSAEAAVGVDVE